MTGGASSNSGKTMDRLGITAPIEPFGAGLPGHVRRPSRRSSCSRSMAASGTATIRCCAGAFPTLRWCAMPPTTAARQVEGLWAHRRRGRRHHGGRRAQGHHRNAGIRNFRIDRLTESYNHAIRATCGTASGRRAGGVRAKRRQRRPHGRRRRARRLAARQLQERSAGIVQP